MRQSHLYEAIKYCAEEYDDPVELSCEILHVSRSAYYKWLKGEFGERVRENEQIAEFIEDIHRKDPDKGYRRISVTAFFSTSVEFLFIQRMLCEVHLLR